MTVSIFLVWWNEHDTHYIFCFIKAELKAYSEILWADVHFSPHNADFLLIQKELPYTSLTSTELLQKQSSFDKIGRSLHFGNFW